MPRGYIGVRGVMEQDLLKIKQSIGKVPPHELGKMFKEYHKKYLDKADTPEPYIDAIKVFDGTLFTNKGAKLISQK